MWGCALKIASVHPPNPFLIRRHTATDTDGHGHCLFFHGRIWTIKNLPMQITICSHRIISLKIAFLEGCNESVNRN